MRLCGFEATLGGFQAWLRWRLAASANGVGWRLGPGLSTAGS